ncbi:hypothetical protein [Lentzea flaviverrucosa]|uniref:Uncharacterized protein n=1 Tax=Lentzea flaviverrucosa TaxID=200379 RepID=A0A1H9HD01_9PSEU|nr:hypothetical protein [Lentzea flaviverrucosa]RDI34628.1 hypothetical protein DFR72_101377 [Lentzea flaviverrucosa]SEQ60205.1 hypothetical protein SAMN05216195_102840 [Lentzea flaviverrucosa]
MPTDNQVPRRSKRYYLVAGALVVLINVVAFACSGRALWPMVLAGTLLGGFLVDGVVDWLGRRRAAGAND